MTNVFLIDYTEHGHIYTHTIDMKQCTILGRDGAHGARWGQRGKEGVSFLSTMLFGINRRGDRLVIFVSYCVIARVTASTEPLNQSI